jgi:hypothetical protein
MKRTSFKPLGAACVGLAAILCGPSPALAQVAPPQGVIQQFSFFGSAAATGSAVLGSSVDGDVGSFPADTVSNFPPTTVGAGFFVRSVGLGDGPLLTQADTDATTAFNALNQGVGTVLPDDLSTVNVGSGVGVLVSGVYTFTSGAALLPAGTTLTFNGPGIFVLRTGSSLTTVATSNMLLSGGADPCDIYWQIGSSATIDSVNSFGNVFADQSVTVTGDLQGKAIALVGAATMTGLTTIGGCATTGAPPPIPVPALPDVATLALVGILLAGGIFAFSRR